MTRATIKDNHLSKGKFPPGTLKNNGVVTRRPNTIASFLVVPKMETRPLAKIPKKKEQVLDPIVQFTLKQFERNPQLSMQQIDRLKDAVRTRDFDIKYPHLDGKIHNLEILEFFGDATIINAHAMWCRTTEPFNLLFQINNGENILTNYRASHLATKWIACASAACGLDTMISYTKEELYKKPIGKLQGNGMSPLHMRDQMIEDVFEAWIGACSEIWTFEEVYQVLVRLLFSIIKIEYRYDAAICAKTRLTMLVAGNSKIFVHKYDNNPTNPNVTSIINITLNNYFFSCSANAPTQKEADEIASQLLICEFDLKFLFCNLSVQLQNYRHPLVWRAYEKAVCASKLK